MRLVLRCSVAVAVLLAAPANADELSALGWLARGDAAMSEGQVKVAIERYQAARAEDPSAPAVERALATALLRAGRLREALLHVERAIELGDDEPEVAELHALILAGQGNADGAKDAALSAHTWEGDLIAASLGDPQGMSRATPWVEEASLRGSLTALVLAASVAKEGHRTAARNLIAASEALARESLSTPVLEAAKELEQRLAADEAPLLRAAARLRTSFDYATNPLYLAEGQGEKPLALRFGLRGEAAVQAPIGTARIDGGFRVDQLVYLSNRDAFPKLDLTGLTAAISLEIPISTRPEAALVGLHFRVNDVFADLFRTHYAITVEGGPSLTIPFDLGTRFVLGIYGIGIDFIDFSPPDAEVSSQNRDRIGQRAVAALIHDGDWYTARAEALFVRDDAYGEAFDARGGALAGHFEARLVQGIRVHLGLSLELRSFGPVGDAVVLGDAAFRTELRTMVGAGVFVPISELFALTFDDVWIRNNARAGHSYNDNIASLGWETRW
ncbi:MAG: tetratricopeptide repeat protein [Myxococcota bacterium]